MIQYSKKFGHSCNDCERMNDDDDFLSSYWCDYSNDCIGIEAKHFKPKRKDYWFWLEILNGN